jgi:hypothetical protein
MLGWQAGEEGKRKRVGIPGRQETETMKADA